MPALRPDVIHLGARARFDDAGRYRIRTACDDDVDLILRRRWTLDPTKVNCQACNNSRDMVQAGSSPSQYAMTVLVTSTAPMMMTRVSAPRAAGLLNEAFHEKPYLFEGVTPEQLAAIVSILFGDHSMKIQHDETTREFRAVLILPTSET